MNPAQDFDIEHLLTPQREMESRITLRLGALIVVVYALPFAALAHLTAALTATSPARRAQRPPGSP